MCQMEHKQNVNRIILSRRVYIERWDGLDIGLAPSEDWHQIAGNALESGTGKRFDRKQKGIL